jgi:magnesium-transporting ATPase (P-type)
LFLILISTERQLLQPETLSKLLDFFTTALAIIIVAVPEGLPLAVSISMAYSIDTMKRDNLLVKNLEACETMGTVTDICTGKTGTLTCGDMTVNAMYTAKLFTNVRENSTLYSIGLPTNVAELIQDCIILNSDARVEMSDDGRYVPVGNSIEVGMLKFLQQSNIEVQDLLVQKSRNSILETHLPFSPERKRQLVAYRPDASADYIRIIIKGAPEYILPMCLSQLSETGSESSMSMEE